MKAQLLLLLELQNIDSSVQELRAKINSLPEKLTPAKNDLAKLEAILQEEKDRLAETESWRKELESIIQTEEEAIKKAKAKVQSAKSSKDYSAANRELENKRKSKSEREDDLLKMMEAIEKSRAEMESHDKDIKALREHLTAEEESIRAEIAVLEPKAEKRAAGRDEVLNQIQPGLLKRYNHIMKKRAYALAPVVDGVCRGCHMQVPPQLNNILARLDSIETCPRCYRMLYRQDILEDAGE
ncbi:MAG: C4-type zinc ribbon domain-containing protein [Proteobacteria bacterium]|nr:C4-type zinc ribbon domain-containing protein [Pseudomonadota bacterium]